MMSRAFSLSPQSIRSRWFHDDSFGVFSKGSSTVEPGKGIWERRIAREVTAGSVN